LYTVGISAIRIIRATIEVSLWTRHVLHAVGVNAASVTQMTVETSSVGVSAICVTLMIDR